MMKFLIVLSVFFSVFNLKAQDIRSALLPMPNQICSKEGRPFILHEGKTCIYSNDDRLEFSLSSLQKVIAEQMQVDLLRSEDPHSDIQLLIDKKLKGEEHYQIEVSSRHIYIKGATPQAVFYGVKTFHQLLMGDVRSTAFKKVRPVVIDDTPRFPYRALMLDPARHFLPVKDVKFYIDQMARYKYNVLQLHLTDDQGWRIAIRKHPNLASEQHYTQEELADLIQYAAQRYIQIVPEMDVPGHTVALLAAYPELGCTTSDTIVKEVGKTVNLMLCASVEKVYQVYDDILKEVAALFPSPFIHLGGDESVIEKNWALCERCQAFMKEEGYSKASSLMIPFFNRMLKTVEKYGKSLILWCELNNIYPPATDYLFPYPKQVTLVSWRAGLTPKCIELTQKYGNSLIMAPGEYTYFDYPQLKGDLPEFNNWGMPVTTLEQSYQFDPGYGLPLSQQAHIQGVMGTLWGEAMLDINRVTYMTFPRALALAEAGWTQMEHCDWESFKVRMYPNLYFLMKKGVSVRVPFEIVNREGY